MNKLSGLGGLKTVQCNNCRTVKLCMVCACDDTWLCYRCCLNSGHAEGCRAETAALRGQGVSRGEYPLA